MSSGDVYQSEYVYNPAWQAVGWVDEYYVTSPYSHKRWALILSGVPLILFN